MLILWIKRCFRQKLLTPTSFSSYSKVKIVWPKMKLYIFYFPVARATLCSTLLGFTVLVHPSIGIEWVWCFSMCSDLFTILPDLITIWLTQTRTPLWPNIQTAGHYRSPAAPKPPKPIYKKVYSGARPPSAFRRAERGVFICAEGTTTSTYNQPQEHQHLNHIKNRQNQLH